MISEKIVIVDDDQRVHSSLRAVLSDYELLSFLDPQEGLAYLLGPNEVRLAMVDVRMKGMDGLELLEKIKRARGGAIAVMIITGHGAQDVVLDALRAHADDYLEKPFDVDELRARVRHLLMEKSQEDPHFRDPHDQVGRVQRFIERNPHNASLSHIAKEMSLSAPYLGRVISRQAGQGFRAYKLKVRMDKAMDMLVNTSLDVSQIALRLGYENPESFMRTFKRYKSMTPSAYRQAHHASRRPS